MASPKHTQYALPPLPYAYNALEPYISEQIMTLHHKQHHQTYVNNLNAALATQAAFFTTGQGTIEEQVHTQAAIRFNAGGHINHSLFWTNLAPASETSASPSPSAQPQLVEQLTATFGSVESFKAAFDATLLGLQGSGWGWLVADTSAGGVGGKLAIVTTKDQDIPPKGLKPLLCVDMWEHAYYLQYQNRKKEYAGNIWNVVNWKVVEDRLTGRVGTEVAVPEGKL